MKKNDSTPPGLALLTMSVIIAISSWQCDKSNFDSIKRSIESTIDEGEKIFPLSKEMKEYNIQDLYVYNEPCFDGTIRQRIYFKEIEREADGKKYFYFAHYFGDSNGIWICEDRMISCGKKWWVPDCRVSTITPLSNYLDILNIYLNRDTLKEDELCSLEQNLNVMNPAYDHNQKYNIEDLVLLNVEGKYSLYSNHNFLIYSTPDNHFVYYFFDITDYKTAFFVEVEYSGEITFGENGNVKDYQITSLNSEKAVLLSDKQIEIKLGSLQKCRIEGISDHAWVSGLVKYLSSEQLNRGYITQIEAEEFIHSLNTNQKRTRNQD